MASAMKFLWLNAVIMVVMRLVAMLICVRFILNCVRFK